MSTLPMPQGMSSWQVPPHASPEERKLAWLNECCQEGNLWHKAQRGNQDLTKAMDVISGTNSNSATLDYRSQLNSNRLKRNVREVVGALSNIRPLWGYHSENPAYTAQAEMLNKVMRAIYLEQFFDRSLKEALQYAAVTCTGWIRPVYRRNMAGTGRGNMQLLTYGSPCVLPVQLPASNDWQEAYSVTLMDEIPIYMAHSLFPDHQHQLQPTMSKYWYSSDIREAAQGNLWKRAFGTNRTKKYANVRSDLYVPIRYNTVIDLAVNRTGQMIPMGEPDSPWYYECPSFGQEIYAGVGPDGQPRSKTADANDARLYPYRRLMISSENCMLYDGPCFNWHGELDLIPFQMDDWPWEALGFSLVRDGYSQHVSINQILRGIMDKVAAQLDLPLGYDINAVTKREAEEFDPMQPRGRIGYDGSQVEKPFAPCVPPEVYKVMPEVLQFLGILNEDMDYQLAIKDVVALGKARALGGKMDTQEALMLADGPIVRDISRSMERSLSRIGNQFKYLVYQYENVGRLMQYVGEDGIANEILDYNPSSIIPSHLPGNRRRTRWTNRPNLQGSPPSRERGGPLTIPSSSCCLIRRTRLRR